MREVFQLPIVGLPDRLSAIRGLAAKSDAQIVDLDGSEGVAPATAMEFIPEAAAQKGGRPTFSLAYGRAPPPTLLSSLDTGRGISSWCAVHAG